MLAFQATIYACKNLRKYLNDHLRFYRLCESIDLIVDLEESVKHKAGEIFAGICKFSKCDKLLRSNHIHGYKDTART